MLSKYKSKIISSLLIAAFGFTAIFWGNWYNNKLLEDNMNAPAEDHDEETIDLDTDVIESEGQYEVWVRVYDLDGNNKINVNFKTDLRNNKDAMLITLNSFEGYNISAAISSGYWFFSEMNGLQAETGTFFNMTSTTHRLCKGNESPYTGRIDSCTTTIDNIWLDNQNVIAYYLSRY